MSDSQVRLDREGPLAILTVDAPPVNLFTRELFDQLLAAIDELDADPPRGLLLRAEGKLWTGGVDVNTFDGLTEQTGGQLWSDLFELIHRVEDLPYPTVFAAHGLCLTWGLELALACDVLLAAESAKFGLVEIVVGLTPSMGGPQRLAERAGSARAREVIFTGELFPAATFEAWNVVNRVYADEAFAEESKAFALKIANGPTKAHHATKQIIRMQIAGGARAADDITPQVSGALFATEDLQHGVESFLTNGPGKATYEGK
ncbi:MAG: enoyl-CoA hydratase/isomerase family protein [Solirubrobacteraceae bacterium]|nr:enoyl-CoA hydratase/isomerase family protein [Solirubrobacteraceae bacterium]